MKHRLFTAISLPDPTRQSLIGVQSRLEHLGLPLRLEDPDKLHITLNFLGRLTVEQIPAVNQVLSQTVGLYSSFTLVPVYLDSMYKKHSDSYVYLNLSGDVSDLKQIQKDLTRSFIGMEIPQRERYLPHITLARYQKADPTFIKSAMDRVSNLEIDPLPRFSVTAITLFESFLSSKGSHYRRVGQFALK